MSAHSDVEWMEGDRLEKAARILTTLAILYCGTRREKV